MNEGLYISQIRLGQEVYDIRDKVSDYITNETSDLVNYTNTETLKSEYQQRLVAGSFIEFTPTTITEDGKRIDVMEISSYNTTYSPATASTDGLMSKENWSKLDGIDSGAQVNAITQIKVNNVIIQPNNKVVAIDVPITTLKINNTTQPITNHAVTLYVNEGYSSTNALAVSSDIPIVNNGTLYIQANNVDKGSFTANSANDVTVNFAAVAFSGSYNDLSNLPNIPTVNDATLTLYVNSTSVGEFSANAAVDTSINLDIPVALSDLTYNSIEGYIGNVDQVLTHDANGNLKWVNA